MVSGLSVVNTETELNYCGRERGKTKSHKRSEGPLIEACISGLSEPGFDPGTCGLWAHHASAAPL